MHSHEQPHMQYLLILQGHVGFALQHLKKNNLRRIIYVIPYTSIIEQNAKVFKDIFGQEVVLEHHYNYEYFKDKQQDDNTAENKIKRASENWDVPIIVTTNVQFFESVYSNMCSKSRKLHNICGSVIIFDEAQMLPLDLLKPCLEAIKELVKHYNSTAIFCTATQPVFKIPNLLGESIEIQEIIDNPEYLYNYLKRVKYQFLGKMDTLELVEKLMKEQQVLCIVNTKKMAKKLYKLLQNSVKAFHLSTSQTPSDRRNIINRIKENLKKNERFIVISTSLVEAGVDFDFATVYREVSGLDSIIQAGGRCNREGRQSEGLVNIFEIIDNFKIPIEVERAAKISTSISDKYPNEIDSLAAINDYFRMLYTVKGDSLDTKGILKCFDGRNGLQYDFETAANLFKVINQPLIPVIINQDNSIDEILKNLRYSEYPLSYKRRLQNYSVGIYPHELEKLIGFGKIEIIHDVFYVLLDDKLYDESIGLTIPAEQENLIL